jgi:23S rRNA (adenine2503-C2)-methyltransferase
MNILGMTGADLSAALKERYGKGRFHSDALLREIVKNGNLDFHLAEEFVKSPSLTGNLKKDLIVSFPDITRIIEEEGTIKFTTKTWDGFEIESVVIPMRNRYTLCLSCQIGCRMGCRFCETGSMGFVRDLLPEEMTAQVYAARFVLRKNIRNIVFMGMGEPFDNFNHVQKAINILNEQKGFDIALSHMTLSTAGVVPGINALGRSEFSGIRLAVSLNAPDDALRSRLMPVNNAYPMASVKKALSDFPLKNRGLFLIGYVLIPGVNDTEGHADELASYLSPLPVRVNVIPLNRTSGFPHTPASDSDVHRFGDCLERRGVFVIKRWSRGSRLQAGCGQLGKSAFFADR